MKGFVLKDKSPFRYWWAGTISLP